MNIGNLNKLIAHLEAQPPERFNMRWVFSNGNGGGGLRVLSLHECGTAACIAGHCAILKGLKPGDVSGSETACEWLGLHWIPSMDLFVPDEYFERPERYSLARAIATLNRLRDTYLSTSQVVVDWGPEPGEEPKQAWTAPQIAEVINPALPAELTSLLRNTVEA